MKRLLMFFTSILILILIFFGIINGQYNAGIKSFTNKKYVDSIIIFENIKFYKKSQFYISQSLRNLENEGDDLVDNNNYKDAITIYEFLLNYNKDIIPQLSNTRDLLKQQEELKEKEALKILKKKYKSIIPYEGLDEEYIELTAWGKADKIELCIDYYKMQPSHQSKEYFWYENNGDSIKTKSVHVLNGQVISVSEHEMPKKVMRQDALREILAAINKNK